MEPRQLALSASRDSPPIVLSLPLSLCLSLMAMLMPDAVDLPEASCGRFGLARSRPHGHATHCLFVPPSCFSLHKNSQILKVTRDFSKLRAITAHPG